MLQCPAFLAPGWSQQRIWGRARLLGVSGFQARVQEQGGSVALEAPRCQLVQIIAEPPAPRSEASDIMCPGLAP